eukprot:CAMPEP_0194262010 /NCGR_PEP_ID=MMETSP0158-20130606/46315_1 /TAXON_ID=33649 /ORGANISM="Thalassionema nitzschioides, Strain L26-B" /LENGTH=160 /DNA_ID=CAMNT_0039002153 /DNA_START=270 /DNA_END=752 /DNA_ORIENTATION=+
MDLWAPVKDSNDYGARSKKKVGLGSLSGKSYIPDGLNKSQYESLRKQEAAKKVANSNDYGARSKKKVGLGSLSGKSYIPDGLNKSQYESLRKQEAAKKAANYDRNVKKAGKFLDYTLFYKQRGTDTGSDWKKSVTLGHRMAKTKYDWQGSSDKKFIKKPN